MNPRASSGLKERCKHRGIEPVLRVRRSFTRRRIKTIIFLGLIISLTTGSYNQDKKSSIEGTWKMVYGKWTILKETYPGQIKGHQIKMLSKEHYTFVGHIEWDVVSLNSYGWGTYTLSGNKFEDHNVLHSEESYQGLTSRLLMEVSNDTLIQRWPADENWNLPEQYNIEKYVRLE